MDIENKLDEDFLFYLGFTKHVNQIKNCDEQTLAQLWLQKLCGESYNSLEQKRNRNIFLSNLLLSIYSGKLSAPFTINPNEVDLNDAKEYFPILQTEVQTPNWLQDVVEGVDEGNGREDGRTYVATRTMPGGEGAFAYVAVNLAEEEPRWLGGGEGEFDAVMHQKFQEHLPPRYEMEEILARRKDPRERQRVLTFYDVLLQNIADELDEKIKEEDNDAVSAVLEQLIADLEQKGEYEEYGLMDETTRRNELLILLYDLTKTRRDKVAKREEVLDNIEADLTASFFEESTLQEGDVYKLPDAMWEYIINRPPNKKNLEILQITYPMFLMEKFLKLLAIKKEDLAFRMHRRHNAVITQMKKDLRRDAEKLKHGESEAKNRCDQAVDILTNVKNAYEDQTKSYEKAENRKKGGETKLTRLYNDLRQTLDFTQNSVEEEAEKGRKLTEQINAISAQSEVYSQVTETSIMKTEQANMDLMRHIKKLQAAILQQDNTLKQMENMRQKMGSGSGKQSQMLIF